MICLNCSSLAIIFNIAKDIPIVPNQSPDKSLFKPPEQYSRSKISHHSPAHTASIYQPPLSAFATPVPTTITIMSTQTLAQTLIQASTSPSYITHQRRPALIPSDVHLSPEDELSVRMRTGCVDPSFLSGTLEWSDNQGRLEAKESGSAGAVGKRKRMASVASAAGNDGCDEDGDHEMVDRRFTGK